MNPPPMEGTPTIVSGLTIGQSTNQLHVIIRNYYVPNGNIKRSLFKDKLPLKSFLCIYLYLCVQ